MKVSSVEPGSIAADLGIRPGDHILELNGKRVLDAIDFRFRQAAETLSLKAARGSEVTIYEIEKDEEQPLGLDFDDMKILSCGNDCIFCFVDQNPAGLREQLYFRDGDYRLSFMYGNYTTMTNVGPAILQRIIEQRLSPQYISVHVTDPDVRMRLMGLKKDDRILEKIQLLHDHGIDMHTQVVLCPGINDGDVLRCTVDDLSRFHKQIRSLAIVPVGLTDHRFGLSPLRKVDGSYAEGLLGLVENWQEGFRKAMRRGFVYASDEFYILAGRPIPSASFYDGFPQIENGIGLVRSFLDDLGKQARRFPKRLPQMRRLTLVTAELPSGIMRNEVLPRLREVGGLHVGLEIVPNSLFGRSVTVAGLLSGKCVYSALKGRDCGDLLLLPPDVVNGEGVMLDDTTPDDLARGLGVEVMVYDGSWPQVFDRLGGKGFVRKARRAAETAVPRRG